MTDALLFGGFAVAVACLCAFPILAASQMRREVKRRRMMERLADRRDAVSPWGEVVDARRALWARPDGMAEHGGGK